VLITLCLLPAVTLKFNNLFHSCCFSFAPVVVELLLSNITLIVHLICYIFHSECSHVQKQMAFVRFPKQTTIISLISINRMTFGRGKCLVLQGSADTFEVFEQTTLTFKQISIVDCDRSAVSSAFSTRICQY